MYFEKLVFLKIPRCSMFILALISKQEMHKIDNAFRFNYSLEIHEENIIIVLLNRNVLAFLCNRKVGQVLQMCSREEKTEKSMIWYLIENINH